MRKLTALMMCTALAACGGGGSSSGGSADGPPPAPPVVTLSAPVTQVLAGAKPVTLSAAVSSGDSVSWQLAPGAPGSISGSGASAQYTPPASISANTPVTITAKAGSTSRNITLTVFPEPGPAGLSLIAGTLGDRALLDGAGDAARFSRISDAAPAIDGGLLIADQYMGSRNYNVLRKIGADRKVTTLLRTAPGHVDGDTGQARLGTVAAITQTSDGAIWFVDAFEGKSYLRRFSNGSLKTVFDTSALGAARLYAAPGPKLYLLTAWGIRQMAVDAGTPTLLAGASEPYQGPPVDGTGAAARFVSLSDLAVTPSGDLIVADGCTLRKVGTTGVVTTIAGQAGDCTLVDGAPGAVRFQSPQSVAVNPAGEMLVLDQATVRKLSVAGAASSLATLPPAAQPSEELKYAYRTSPTLIRINAAGEVLLIRESQVDQLAGNQAQTYAGMEDDSSEEIDGKGPAARFLGPIQLSADLAGNIFVVDDRRVLAGKTHNFMTHRGIRLRKIAPDGTVTTLIQDQLLHHSTGIANGPDGSLYMIVQDSENSEPLTAPYGGAVYKVQADGTLTFLAGRPGLSNINESYYVQRDGQGDAARFSHASMAGIDGDGNIYVNDAASVRKVTPDGMVTTIPALPAALGRAPDGFRYKADQSGWRVTRVNADGGETTVAGGAEVPGTVLGALHGGLNAPRAIVPTGPYSFAIAAGSAILKLVLPH